jgi:two-component system phosphate regulon sensor histidine kinase PhoR
MTEEYDDYDSELISIVAHDLKTPVSAVRGFIELVQNLGPLTEQQGHFLERAMSALSRMEQLIASLLDLARIQSGIPLELVETDINRLVEDALELLRDVAAQSDISIHVDSSPESVVIQADNRLMGHVINNLLSNAVKYNREGGDVWLKIRQQDKQVRVDVRDNGIGIPYEDQPRVFERFFRAKREKGERISGSGLGLAISQSIIELHNGEILLESTPNVGSTFSFIIPADPSGANNSASVNTHTGAGNKFNIFSGERASETSDGVDDSQQESADLTDSDSGDDEP